jgi:hypothetical protein
MFDALPCKTTVFKKWKNVEALELVSLLELFLLMQHALGSYHVIWRGNGQEAESY